MSNAAVAGFDPIFYLHHTNVDRMLSLWSALNPGVWVTPGDAEDGTFTIPALAPVDTNTPLTPFYNKETTFWPSAATVSTAQLGYTYPEFNGLDMGNKEAVRVAIANKVNQLYGLSVFAGAPSATDSLARGPSAPAPELIPPNRGLYEWTARVECKQFEIPISYLVAIFLGEIPDDPKEWQVSPNYIGSHYAFVNSAAKECENCRNKTDVIIEGYVHLNRAIVKSSGLKSLEPKAVLPYLSENLHWRVLKVDGQIAELKSLDVSVHAAPLDYSGGAIFPVAGEDRRYGRVTHDATGKSSFVPDP
jgi:tyrosinase